MPPHPSTQRLCSKPPLVPRFGLDRAVNGQFNDVTPRKKVETVQLLIEHGLAVTTKDENLSAPLHLASSSGVPELVRLLIAKGADVKDKDGSGRTPLHLASSWVSAKVTLLTSHILDTHE